MIYPMVKSKFVAVDLFAGPGGLGEGFSQAGFDIICSVEKDKWAARTLRTRVMFKTLKEINRTSLYWDYIRGDKTGEEIINLYSELKYEIDSRVLQKTISDRSRTIILKEIKNRLKSSGSPDLTVLLGGPPCQLYSIIGRSRYSSMMDKFYRDPRRRLFEHYIFFLRELRPKIFVFENVYGITSATLKRRRLLEILFEEFDKCGYIIPEAGNSSQENGYILNSLHFGIPQKRKRLILIGYRRDFKCSGMNEIYRDIREKYPPSGNNYPVVRDAIGDLPPVRPGEGNDKWFGYYPNSVKISDYAAILRVESEGVLNHRARTHMEKDLERYKYFIESNNNRIKANLYNLKNERPDLLPAHRNLDVFLDRFKVQAWDNPASTITSHLARDGHYYIHPDINQLRSFTVREAARFQSFPDNYFFEGPRTEQFRQVGNAVPPLLARGIAILIVKKLENTREGNWD